MNFYFTFGFDHKTIEGIALKDYWVKVNANTEEEAREAFIKYNEGLTGNGLMFATCYPEYKFQKDFFPKGQWNLINLL